MGTCLPEIDISCRNFFAQAGESAIPFFVGHIHERTSVKEFFDLYDGIMQKERLKEAFDDIDSSGLNLLLRIQCYYELQLSKFYTKEMFEKFQVEVEMMSSCGSINQVNTFGSVITYLVKEHKNSGIKEFRNFEVIYDKAALEIQCVCSGFYLNGYLCRHCLERPEPQWSRGDTILLYLQRWRKDYKRLYVLDLGSNVDITNPTQWYEHLHKRAMQVWCRKITI